MGSNALDAYFNSVYSETFASVSRYVVSKCGSIQESEDILQNIYARFYQRIAKKGYEDIENAEAFVINIAKFECKNYFGFIKKHSVSNSFADFSEEQMVAVEAEMSREQKSLEDVLCNSLVAKQIFNDIANDDPVTGRIFYLHFVCDMKLDEVAKALDLNLSTVKNKLYRTIERQKKKFNL